MRPEPPSTRRRAIRAAARSALACAGLIASCGDPTPRTTRDAGADSPGLDAPGLDAPTDDGGALDAPATDAGTPSAPLALGARDVPVTPVVSARIPDVVFEPSIGAYVVTYGWVVPGTEFRTEARTIRIDAAGTPIPSAPVTIDPLASPAHNSAEAAIAFGPGGAGLVVFTDDRLSGGSGMLDVWGQRVRTVDAVSPPTLEGAPFRISNVDVTGESLGAVAWLGDRFFVAWADDRERGVRHEDARVVYGRTVASDGTIGAEMRLGDDALFQTFPQIASCGGRALVVWADYVPAGGGVLVTHYRARILDGAGAPVGGIVPIAAIPSLPPDPAGIACDETTGSWRVTWTAAGPPSIRQIGTALVASDGTVSDARTITSGADGSGSPRLARVRARGTWALSFHAQDSTFGYAVELAANADPMPPIVTLTAAAPRLGSFWTSIAAHPTAPEVLVVTTLDYDRISATVLRSP